MPTTRESLSVVRARTEEVVIVTIGEGPAQARVGTPADHVPEGPDHAPEHPDSALEDRAPAEEVRATIARADRALAATVVRVPGVPEDLAAFAGPMTVVPAVMIADFAGMIGVRISLRSILRPSELIFFRNQPRS